MKSISKIEKVERSTMKECKIRTLRICFFVLAFLIISTNPVAAELILTPEEMDYIEGRKVITTASIDGGAPLHYTDSKGQIRGIAINTLDKIGEMTGLHFDYRLYELIDDVFKSDTDIILGITSHYAPEGMVLSQPYLESETILFINSSLDPNQLDDKQFASVENGIIPDGIKKENVVYYNSREDTLDAVEKGKADYGYGNEYSVSFYMIQKAYKNIIIIPKAIESRAYTIGFPKEDEVLLSIINKSIDEIEDHQMNQIILDTASQIERKISFSMIMEAYGGIISTIVMIVIGVLLWGVVVNIRARKNLVLQNKRYEFLAQISNEYLFEYCVRTNDLRLSQKIADLFEGEDNFNEAINSLKSFLLDQHSKENIETVSLSLESGAAVIFKVIYSIVYGSKGKIHSIIGKLIDISEEEAKKEDLIIKSERDGLTGLYNQTTMKTLVSENIKNKNEDGLDALILLDCDDFKNINDIHGHLAGDRALKNVSMALQSNFRRKDIIGRMGGDEFSVYVKDAPSRAHLQVKCEKLIQLIKEMDTDFNLTLSIGIAFLKDEQSYDDLFNEADGFLYQAKKMGRARVVSRE